VALFEIGHRAENTDGKGGIENMTGGFQGHIVTVVDLGRAGFLSSRNCDILSDPQNRPIMFLCQCD